MHTTYLAENKLNTIGSWSKAHKELQNALESTQTTNLNNVKREVILDVINHSDSRYIETHSDYLDMVIEYANKKYPIDKDGE